VLEEQEAGNGAHPIFLSIPSPVYLHMCILCGGCCTHNLV
jgi:hypothetical protein